MYLRAENERKTKKKGRRYAVLGNNITLSVQEGLDRIQQLDMQVEEQASRPRQRAPPRCSGCGIVGHTIKKLSK